MPSHVLQLDGPKVKVASPTFVNVRPRNSLLWYLRQPSPPSVHCALVNLAILTQLDLLICYNIITGLERTAPSMPRIQRLAPDSEVIGMRAMSLWTVSMLAPYQ